MVLVSQKEIDLHTYDAWPVASKWKLQGNIPVRPISSFVPFTPARFRSLVRFAVREGVPITPWGLGSSVTGSSLPLHGGITFDLSAMKRILDIDAANHMVTVEAGVLGSDLEKEVNGHGFTLGNSPQSLDRSTVGGWLSTRATGQFSSLYGGIEDLVVTLLGCTCRRERFSNTPCCAALFPRPRSAPDLHGRGRHHGRHYPGYVEVISPACFPPLEAIRFGSVEAGRQGDSVDHAEPAASLPGTFV